VLHLRLGHGLVHLVSRNNWLVVGWSSMVTSSVSAGSSMSSWSAGSLRRTSDAHERVGRQSSDCSCPTSRHLWQYGAVQWNLIIHSLQLQFAEFGFKISQFTAIVLSHPTRVQNDKPFEPIFTVFPPFTIFNLRLHAIGTYIHVSLF